MKNELKPSSSSSQPGYSDRLLAPGARVVKALNNMIVPNLEADPVVNGARRVAFISADDDRAKKRVETLLENFAILSLILETFAMEA
jgi:predicted dinucleotide-binding enzyme